METLSPPPSGGWQAVYILVRDTRNDVLKEVAEVKTDVAGLRAMIDTHLLGHAANEGVQVERVRVAKVRADRREYVRTLVATALPIPTAIIAVLALLAK